jgi:hypothetical protein
VWPIVVFIVFIVGLVIGSLIAQATGHLPSAEALQVEDQERIANWARER